MNYKLVAEVIFIGSSIGLGGIIFKKIPVLSALSKKEIKEEDKKPKLTERLRKVKFFRKLSYEKFLQKFLTKVRILSLKTDNKTSSWLKKLKDNSQRKKITEDDKYWDEIKKATKG